MNGIGNTRLAELLAGDVPVASVYFDQRSTADAPLRWSTIARGLSGQGAPAAVLDALAQQVVDVARGPGVLAAFARGDDLAFARTLPGASSVYLGRYGALPYLTPLLAWEQQHPARVLAVLDRTGADISVYPAGSTDPLDTAVTGPDDEIERNAPGGWSQGRYQHRAEDSWEHNSTAVAQVLARLLKHFDARILLLAGDVRALQYLDQHLPRWIHAGVTIRRLSGGRSEDGSAVRRAEQLVVRTQEIVGEQNEALLAEYADHVGTGGAAVQGPDETFAALAAGRVRTLLLPDNAGEERAWFGPGPTDVALRPETLRQADIPAYDAPLEDVAVRAALLTDADVRVFSNGQAPFGIAALCRFTP